jgi:hypothetical protein
LHYLYLDETGDHGLSFIDHNFPIFLLCGCLFNLKEIENTEKKFNLFKQKYFNTSNVILHSREIRKCEGSFQILFDLNLKAEFYEDMNLIIKNSKFKIIGVGINKEEYIKRYGKSAKDPYALSLSFIIERLIFYLDELNKEEEVEIIAEKRGVKEDKKLLSQFNSTLDLGTYYLSSDRVKKKIEKFEFKLKKDNIIGLQVADLCAYPLARHLLNSGEPYIPFRIIEEKIYCNKKGEYDGWGLKLFP